MFIIMKKLFILFISIISLFGCNLEPSFQDIVNKNLIPEGTFDQWFHTDTATIGSANETYLLYEQESVNGGFSGSEAYRLELKNLMPNGDFETGALGAGWSGTGTIPGVSNSGSVEDVPIDGNSLHYDFNSGSYVSFDLGTISDGALNNTKYRLHFDFRVETGILFDYNDGTNSYFTDPNLYWIENYTSWGTREFPTVNKNSIITTPSIGGIFFSIGTPDPAVSSPSQNGYLDNLSIVKADGTYGIAYTLEGSINSEGIELIPGTYRFSVYVKQELDADVTPATLNRFRAEYVELSISGPLSNLNTDENRALFPSSSEWSDWTKISVDSDSLRPAEGSSPITMTIFAYNHNNRYSGSILVSAPILEYIP
jgi:hypothetical protein